MSKWLALKRAIEAVHVSSINAAAKLLSFTLFFGFAKCKHSTVSYLALLAL